MRVREVESADREREGRQEDDEREVCLSVRARLMATHDTYSGGGTKGATAPRGQQLYGGSLSASTRVRYTQQAYQYRDAATHYYLSR